MVWVGFDDNQPVGLSGSQAALPIWTRFMKHSPGAQACHSMSQRASVSGHLPLSGKLACRLLPRTFNEAFLAGTEPTAVCDLHRDGEVR